ncbi:4Fe-4S binding protein [bacterium]|nr:4Fe-4S binding protein [bacterium]
MKIFPKNYIVLVFIVLLVLVIGCSKDNEGLPVLDDEKCVGCGECVSACPYDALVIIDGKPVIDPAKCTGCGICVESCPYGALYLP